MWLMLVLAAVLVGTCLGLMGAGGSIITVPILILLLEMDEKLAVQHALIIVGLISLFGAIWGMRKQPCDSRALLLFALASLPMASAGALIGKQLPEGWQTLILVALMLFSAYKMLFGKPVEAAQQQSALALLHAGGGTGLITGLVGIGGGFLIVPALVLFAGLSMQQAVTNSLLLIAANALFAFASLNLAAQILATEWQVVGTMVVSGALAIIIGQLLAAHTHPKTLKTSFGLCLTGAAITLLFQLD